MIYVYVEDILDYYIVHSHYVWTEQIYVQCINETLLNIIKKDLL